MEEGELSPAATVKDYLTVQTEGAPQMGCGLTIAGSDGLGGNVYSTRDEVTR